MHQLLLCGKWRHHCRGDSLWWSGNAGRGRWKWPARNILLLTVHVGWSWHGKDLLALVRLLQLYHLLTRGDLLLHPLLGHIGDWINCSIYLGWPGSIHLIRSKRSHVVTLFVIEFAVHQEPHYLTLYPCVVRGIWHRWTRRKYDLWEGPARFADCCGVRCRLWGLVACGHVLQNNGQGVWLSVLDIRTSMLGSSVDLCLFAAGSVSPGGGRSLSVSVSGVIGTAFLLLALADPIWNTQKNRFLVHRVLVSQTCKYYYTMVSVQKQSTETYAQNGIRSTVIHFKL